MPALISKKMSIIIVSYMLLMIMYRFVLPYGDEPDFSVRVSDILYGDLIFYSPYSFSLVTSLVVIVNLALYYIL